MEDNQKISKSVQDILRKGPSRQVGDIHPKKSELVWTEYKPGKFDWRKKSGNVGSTAKKKVITDPKKIKAALEKVDDDKLAKMAGKANNSPDMRQIAYDILDERGYDVSTIDMNNGKLGKLKTALGVGAKDDDLDSDESDGDGISVSDLMDNIDNEEDEIDWRDPDILKNKFGGLKTKKQRIEADAYVHNRKIQEETYIPPKEEIYDLNMSYYQFLKSNAPLMIASGGAGVGKTYNFKNVAQALSKRPFDPETDEPGDADYEYVEAPEMSSPTQLVNFLKLHNGKIILFDDSDNILKDKESAGILKKATADSGDRMVGKASGNKNSNVDPFKYTGQIIFLTNMNQHELTKDDNAKAIYSRAAFKKDIYFTKKEQLRFMDQLKYLFDFTSVPRLDDPDEDKAERKEVFELIRDNIDLVDPQKFNSRTMMEILSKKRAVEDANREIRDNPAIGKLLFGDNEKDWKKEASRSLKKGYTEKDVNSIKKALRILDLTSDE